MRALRRAGAAPGPGGAGPATVLSAADALWPNPGSHAIGRRRTGPGAVGTSYAVVPTMRRPRYLVPRAPGAAVALRPAQGGVKGLRMLGLSYLQRWSVLPRLPGQHLHVLPGPTGAGIEDLVGSMIGEVSYVVVRLGRPRPNRTLVVWVFGADGAPVAIAKVSRGDAAQQAMEIEYAALAQSPASEVRGLVAPRALGYIRWHDSDVLVISALVSPGARPSHVPPVPQMTALAASAGAGETPLRSTAFAGRLAAEIEALVSEADRSWLRRGLEDLLGDLGGTVVRTGAWHGDWVSWNQSCGSDGVLLWDWEHYTTSALAGFDHVHFLAQEQRSRGTDARAEDVWLATADTALAEAWGMDADQRRAVLRGYLLEVNLRFVRDRQGEEDAPARTGWGRQLVERLVGPPGA